MPRGKSSTARRSTGGKQTPLSFSTNKVTKPGAASTPSAKAADAKSKALLSDAPVPIPSPQSVPAEETEVDLDQEEEEEQEQEEQQTTSELSIRAQVKAGPEPSEDEQRAVKITDGQVKRYWKAKEDSRISPRVHQEGLTVHDKVLREFDLSSHFGPCIGVAREKRWNRAKRLGLEPPIEVLAVLLKENMKTNPKVQRAYVDELMASTFTVD